MVWNADFKEKESVRGAENRIREMCHLLIFVVGFVWKVEMNIGSRKREV